MWEGIEERLAGSVFQVDWKVVMLAMASYALNETVLSVLPATKSCHTVNKGDGLMAMRDRLAPAM
jgi:hypothetical protein